jgi:chemotaxis signal transduction protein
MTEEPQFEGQAENAPLMPEEAAGTPAETDSAPERQYCVFRAGRERYCLAVLDVEEVVDWPPVTALPLAPAFLMGIFNLRGAIVPIVDISIREGRRPDLPPRRVMVARWAGEQGREDVRLGIAADEVFGTYSTREPLLVDEAPRDVPHCCGMLRHPAEGAGASSATAGADWLALALDLRRVAESFPVPAI